MVHVHYTAAATRFSCQYTASRSVKYVISLTVWCVCFITSTDTSQYWTNCKSYQMNTQRSHVYRSD